MEVITGLVLILLSSVGARIISVHMDQPSELSPVFDDLPSYMKTAFSSLFPTGELVESVVYVEDLGLNLNKNADEDEKVEHHVYSVVNLDTDINMNNQKVSNNNKEEEMDSALISVEAIEGQNNKKTEAWLLEDRGGGLTGDDCPKGKYRIWGICCKEDTVCVNKTVTT